MGVPAEGTDEAHAVDQRDQGVRDHDGEADAFGIRAPDADDAGQDADDDAEDALAAFDDDQQRAAALRAAEKLFKKYRASYVKKKADILAGIAEIKAWIRDNILLHCKTVLI